MQNGAQCSQTDSEEPQRRRRRAARRREPSPTAPASVSAGEVNHLVKDLRRCAHILRSPPEAGRSGNATSLFFRDVLWPAVRTHLESQLRAPREGAGASRTTDPLSSASAPLRIRLVGLGIGPFSRRESRSSFVQMATFVALRDSCVDWLSHCIALERKAAGGAVGVEDGLAGVRTSFFDPLSHDALHGECCRRLRIEPEEENCRGAYRPQPGEVLLLFMPHCPWVLMHNALLANWPSPSSRADTEEKGGEKEREDHLSLRRLLLVANDLREGPSLLGADGGRCSRKDEPWTVCSPALPLLLHFTELFPKRQRRARHSSDGESNTRRRPLQTGNTWEDHEDGSAGLPGLSRNDVVEAFFNTAVMSLADGLLDAEVREKLIEESKGKPHAIIRKAPELFEMVERKGRPSA